jgi:hypothetical protein
LVASSHVSPTGKLAPEAKLAALTALASPTGALSFVLSRLVRLLESNPAKTGFFGGALSVGDLKALVFWNSLYVPLPVLDAPHLSLLEPPLIPYANSFHAGAGNLAWWTASHRRCLTRTQHCWLIRRV